MNSFDLEPIVSFSGASGANGFLSNTYNSPMQITVCGCQRTAKNLFYAFQVSKFVHTYDISLIDSILNARSPVDAKSIADNNEKKIGVIGKKRPSDGKKVKRGPYKCGFCGDMLKRHGKPHPCRPTRDQVVDKIILRLSGKGKRRAVHDKGKNLCGKCHHLKTECNCLDEYGRIARVVRGLTSYTGGDNLQQDRDVIGTEIDNSMDFKFSEVDGRRNPVDYDASITTTFVDDHAPADAGLQDGDPVDVGFSHRPLPPQAFLHMDQLRQGEASSQVSASRCGFQRNISLQGMAPSCFCFSSAIHTGQP